jgi:hypothetical protein
MNTLPSELHADGPHEALGEQAHVFDRFVGTWDCDYTNFAEDGTVSQQYPGHVTFGWILDGHAMQDVWSGQVGDHGGRVAGTSIRFFDAETDLWTVVWIFPPAGVITTVRGGVVGDRIVLEGRDADGASQRWSFNDIRRDSFTWLGERSTDGGSTWRLAADYRMVRGTSDA